MFASKISYKIVALFTKNYPSFDPPKQREDCYQSITLPPSHHGWIGLLKQLNQNLAVSVLVCRPSWPCVRNSLHYYFVSFDIFFSPIRLWIGYDNFCARTLPYIHTLVYPILLHRSQFNILNTYKKVNRFLYNF